MASAIASVDDVRSRWSELVARAQPVVRKRKRGGQATFTPEQGHDAAMLLVRGVPVTVGGTTLQVELSKNEIAELCGLTYEQVRTVERQLGVLHASQGLG